MEQSASDLCLVHRLRGRQAAEFMEQIKKGEAGNENEHERTAHPDRRAARFEGVNRSLDCIGATGHRKKMTKPDYRNSKGRFMVASAFRISVRLRRIGFRDFPSFISLILRCRVRRLMPSFFAAAVMLPFVEESAWLIRRLSVACRSSGLVPSSKASCGAIPAPATPAARPSADRARSISDRLP